MSSGHRGRLFEHLSGFISATRRRRLEAVLAERTRRVTVVLEDVYQPHNASAVLRSCECFGIQDVHVVEANHEYQINKDVAQGSSKWLTLRRHTDLQSCVEFMRQGGYRLVAATPHQADCSLDELGMDAPVAIMLGTEDTGLSPAALEAADLRVRLPMYGFTESLNVSVCAAPMLRDALLKLRAGAEEWRLSAAEQQELRWEWYRRSIRGVEMIERRFEAEQGR
jgi:tRNA (guanosine-2'-O-)-methyltransferase